MAKTTVLFAALLLCAVFINNSEAYHYCFYRDIYRHVVVIHCPTVLLLRSGVGEENKDCTQDNPCPYEGDMKPPE
ncbi:hypothetical protein QE152_g38599 [Popillia japonica]|uniref:Uncharacterized protein n=1 Tax=Popillia japonica TaxID=7064 RepID=A0AAW1HX89_POPJA